MDEKFKQDYFRYKKKKWTVFSGIDIWKSQCLSYMKHGRLSCKKGLFNWYHHIVHVLKGRKMCNEIPFERIDSGLLLMHPYGITVNPGATIGKDVTLFKGCTIGSVRSGKSAGVPTIGDRVTICCNAMVCGNIKVGNDVLIAAGAFVNFDVPDNSIVVGNPGVIHHKENASKDYL